MAGAEGDGLCKRAKLLSCPPWDKLPPSSIPTDCANFPVHLLHFRWVMFTLLVSSENCPWPLPNGSVCVFECLLGVI